MRVLIACEYSGTVRDAFAQLGHDAWSCDLLPTETPGNHIQGDVRSVLGDGWDLMVAHPPCQYLSYAGMRWFKVQPDRMDKARIAFDFFMELVNAPIPQIAIENPKGFPLAWYRISDQKIQPWMFGEPYTKETHFWLKDLPPLMYTQIHIDPFINWARNKSGSHSPKARAKTFSKIAAAMAHQWGQLPAYKLA